MVLKNIQTYIDELEVFYVVDNSDIVSNNVVEELKKIDKIRYIHFNKNRGIAYPLNFILSKVRDYEFLLTMDQDSCFKPNMMKKYKEHILTWTEKDSSIAVFAADNTELIYNISYKFEQRVMMSGNVLKTAIAQLARGFNESLFIDEVDHEFCYRLRKLGYKILIFYDIKMEHHLGNITCHNIWTGYFNTTNHCGIRRYYMARNMLYVMNEYPKVKWQYFKDFIKMVIKIILSENNKLEKIKYIIKGIQDYKHGKFGEFQ